MSEFSPIPLLIPALPKLTALRPYLEQIDANRYYSNFGPLTRELETRLAGIFENHASHPMHVTTVSSATTGLELALSSLDLPRGSLVVVPALTFVATLTAVIRAGFVPVVADVDADNWLLTPEIVRESAASTGASAAIVVSAFGQPVDTALWSSFQENTGISIVIDAAGGFGSQWVQATDIPVVFSMHATKSLAAGEGGFIVSGNHDFIRHITELSNFGINLDPSAGLPVGYLTHAGSNAKLSEYHAAVAHASLDNWESNAEKRQSAYRRYRDLLNDACGDAIIWQKGVELTVPNMLCIRLGNSEARSKLEDHCKRLQIATRRWYQPLLHHHSANISPLVAMPCPAAEGIASGLLGLPFFVDITDIQIRRVVDAVAQAVSQQDYSTQKQLTRKRHGQYSDIH
ncbi:perosamine synthetase [Methylophilaceae bacterium]|nr:perosamine synthetase [Methylophilaceae bacterium]